MSIPTQATGTPLGICAIERSASIPLNFAETGTPITGLSVREATAPGSAAESPAMQIKTFASEFFTISPSLFGSLWKEQYSMEYFALLSLRIFSVFLTISSSDLLPAIINTSGIIINLIEMIKIAVLGIGRMGREIIKQAVAEKFHIVAAIDSPKSEFLGKDAGILSGLEPIGVNVESSENLAGILDRAKPDVAVDFTNADACAKNSRIISDKKVNMVIGTTGLTEEQMSGLKNNITKNNIGAVISPNMSVGVNVFWNLVRDASKFLKDYDIEIIEAHHRFKKDKPSGTAIKTAEVISKELGRNRNEIPVHSIRAGDIAGDHTAVFATLGERIEITHRAHSRMAFVNGVIMAVKFIYGKRGIYGMGDVLEL